MRPRKKKLPTQVTASHSEENLTKKKGKSFSHVNDQKSAKDYCNVGHREIIYRPESIERNKNQSRGETRPRTETTKIGIFTRHPRIIPRVEKEHRRTKKEQQTKTRKGKKRIENRFPKWSSLHLCC